MNDLLTVFDVALRVSAHPETVRRWVRAGRLPCVRIGRKVLIEREALERVLRGDGAGRMSPIGDKPTPAGAPEYPAGNRAGGDASHDAGESWEPYRFPAETRQPRIIG